MFVENEIIDFKEESIDKLTRVGFITRGLVYGTIGILATKLSLGISGGKTIDSFGLLKVLAEQPFGQLMLIPLFIGFAGYSLWRFIQAYNNFKEYKKYL